MLSENRQAREKTRYAWKSQKCKSNESKDGYGKTERERSEESAFFVAYYVVNVDSSQVRLALLDQSIALHLYGSLTFTVLLPVPRVKSKTW